MSDSRLNNRNYSLDVLRGLAALSVVLWHWQHFFYVAGKPVNFTTENQPFFEYLSLFYLHGSLAVELFFSISGFVFFWLYAIPIQEKKEKLTSFFIKRFSRLYPLYILTFALVATLQIIYFKYNNYYFVYQLNDFYHAALNILMIPAWGFEQGYSFNGPVWSVSIEILMYSLFYLVCKTKATRILSIPISIITGLFILNINPKISMGLICFFMGGMTFYLYDFFSKNLGRGKSFIVSSLFLATSIVINYFFQDEKNLLVYLTLFPAITAWFFSIGEFSNLAFKKISWIGDISYSTYLIHFPLQIVFSLSAQWYGFSSSFFTSKITMLTFFFVLIIISLLSHRLFELNAQAFIRRKY